MFNNSLSLIILINLLIFFLFSSIFLGVSEKQIAPQQNLVLLSILKARIYTNKQQQHANILPLAARSARRAIFRTKRRKKMMEIAKLGISCQFAHSRKHTRPLIRGKQ